MQATYSIPECNLSELESRIEKLNRRAVKLGVPEIVVTKQPECVKHQVRQLTTGQEIGGPATKLVWRDSIEKVANPGAAYLANAFEPTGVVMAWWSVTVTGETPSFDGWEFIAVLEPMHTEDGDALNLIQAVPGMACPIEYRTRIGECDHCHAFRNRKQTFVVRHMDGSHKCVGRQCVKDFLGYNGDPHALAAWSEMLAELGDLCESAGDEEFFGCGRLRDDGWDLRHFLTLTACRIRLFGWLGRGKAEAMFDRRQSTADNVLEILTPPNKTFSPETYRAWEEFVAKHEVNDSDKAMAEAAIEWAKSIPSNEIEGNDYLANVNLVARVGVATRKTVGIAASVIVAYAKAMEWEVNRQRQAAKPESNWVGEIGVRIPMLKVTCEKVIANEGSYGVIGIHKMADEFGNDLTWFASSGDWLKEGETVHIAASVKKHGEFRGRKQTILTRVKVLTDEQVAKELAKASRKAKRQKVA